MSKVDQNLKKALRLVEDVMKHPANYPDRFIALPLEPTIVAGLLTPERLRILKFLRESGPVEGVAKLAASMGRDPTRVSRDLKDLAEYGLVRAERKGKKKIVRGTRRPIVIA